MSITRTIKKIVQDTSDKVYFKMAHRTEIQKFKDPRRREIANSYPLTKEQKVEIDELYVTNYGEKIDYVWHQNYAAHSNKFDYRFFPELLFIPEFELYQNHNLSANRMMGDKNFLPIVAKAAGVKMPETIVSCTNGVLRDNDNHILTSSMCEDILHKNSQFFVKPATGSCSGKSCKLVTESDVFAINRNALVINNNNGDGGYSSNYVIQEVVKTHTSISALHPESVNTFRIITYLWKDTIETMPVILRIGRGKSNVDNAHAGGMFIAVHSDGSLGDHAVTEFNQQFTKHPDSGIVFKDYVIASYDKMILAAKRMHEMVPQIGVVNWDFTVDADGEPILIEANISGGSIWLPQMVHGVGAFEERTEEVLQWLRFMKKLKPSERKTYVGGKMG